MFISNSSDPLKPHRRLPRPRLILISLSAAAVGALVFVLALILFSNSSPYPDSRNDNRHRNYGFTKIYNVRRAANEASGINLGCVLKARNYNDFPPDLALDEYDLDAIRRAGFRHLRVSVEFLESLDEAEGGYRLDPALLERLDRLLKNILEADMIAHLDFHELLPEGKHAFDSEEEGARNEREFLAVWRILSERYKAWSTALYFELANEPHKPITPAVWNEYVRRALALIRSSGGNNRMRPVIVAVDELTDPYDEVKGILSLELPSVEEDPNILVTFHYYRPFEFTWQSETFNADLERYSKDWVGNTWDNTEAQKALIRKDFDLAAAWGKEHGRKIILGEFGVSTGADIVSQINWTRFVREEAEARGMIWLVWQLFEEGSIGALYNESIGFFRKEILDALMPEDNKWKADASPPEADAREVGKRIGELDDPDSNVRRDAARALRTLHPRPDRPETAAAAAALTTALNDEEWQVRLAASRALAVLGAAARPAVPALTKALGDGEWWVRKAAAQALAALGPAARPATARLIALLGDEEWLVRKAAIQTLSCVAPDDRETRKALKKSLHDPEDQVRIAAQFFLRTLEDERE
jgi:endoglucanase